MPTNADQSSDLASPNLEWERIGRWTGFQLDELPFPLFHTWPCCGSQSHQMFSFVREQSMDGQLFLIAAFNPSAASAPGGGTDYLDLYRVSVDRYGNPPISPIERFLHHVERKHVTTDSIAGDTSHFAGSTGVYVSPSGELIVYATEHTNQGPPDAAGHFTVRGGEWRHRAIVRPDSPTLRPSVDVLASAEVDEGSAITINAQGHAPATRAWIQLFQDDDLDRTGDHFNDHLVIDYEDRSKDDFDDFTKLMTLPDFNDRVSSWRWFAPQGCTMRASQDSIGDASYPGRYKTLDGAGGVIEAANLDAVPSDTGAGSMNDMLSSVTFDCGQYYTTPIAVAWDLDRDGSFEAVGNTAIVSASAVDGPGTIDIDVVARHETDRSLLGQSEPRRVEIHVRNVAPAITTIALSDALGRRIGADLPFGITGLEYSALASFTDPGTPDHQTAALDWGDGLIEQSHAFRSFTDAFGGAIGQLAQGHAFGAAGTYNVGLEVVDDDGGVATANATVQIVTPETAITNIIAAIDALLGSTTDQQVRRELQRARRALAGGSTGTSKDGVLDKLAGGQTAAALTKIREAIDELRRAGTSGADVSTLIVLLEQIASALAAA